VRLVIDIDEAAVRARPGADDRDQLNEVFAELIERLIRADAEQHRR
jgi:hypothetical protein